MTQAQKDCYGILDTVFPMGKKGLREITTKCFSCNDRKECLQAALNTEHGIIFRGEIIDRSPANGLLARFKRWSDRKDLSRRLKEKKEKTNDH